MSTCSTTKLTIVIIYILYAFIISTCEGGLFQAFFYSVEWTSSVPESNIILGDTFEVAEISLITKNKIIDIVPTIIGFKHNTPLTDNSYSTKTYPTQKNVAIKWDFKQILTPINYITIITNCGDKKPSLFCSNSKLIFNTSTGREAIHELNYHNSNILKIIMFTYDNECDNNTLLLDKTESIDKQCEGECEECLHSLYIDLDSYIMNTSTSTTNNQCLCPSYSLELIANNHLQIWQNDEQLNEQSIVGEIVPFSDLKRVQITWIKWMGVYQLCRQKYIPNVDDFMTVPSYRSMSIKYKFNHTNGPLFINYTNDKTQIDYFRLNIEQYLNDLFNLSWVYSVYFYEDIKSFSYEQEYEYNIDIGSNNQTYSSDVIQLQSLYNISYNNGDINDGIIDIVSYAFDTNSTYISGFYGVNDMNAAPNDSCYTYFQTTTTEVPIIEDGDENKTVLIAISLVAVAILLLFTALILVICYFRHLACFKLEWDKKPITKTAAIATAATATAATATKGEGETMNVVDNQHIKSGSIRISSKDVAYLRAKTVNKDSDPVAAKHLKVKQGVSERVLQPSDLQKSIRREDIGNGNQEENQAIYYSNSIYQSNKSNKSHAMDKSYDYGRHSNRSHQQQDTQEYGPLSQYSSSPDVAAAADMIELEHININKHVGSADFEKENKIDDVLNKAKRSNKVIEFTDFEKELKLIKIIGQGSFGKVYKAKWDAEFVAVKIFTSASNNNATMAMSRSSKTSHFSGNANTNASHSHVSVAGNVKHIDEMLIDNEQYKELYSEIVLATSIPPHPNIIRINGFCRKPLCVVMEYMAGGSVQKLVYGLTNKPIPSVIEKFIILVKSCYGLAKLTEYNLHHRDVAARNILLGEYGTDIDSNTKVKITDFGMTRKDEENNKVQKTKQDGGPYKWMAPESIQKQVYNEKTDVYMFAITIWEIMYGREPYEDMDAINTAMNVCMKDERPEFLWDLPSGLKTLIKKCWDKDAEKRPTFKEVAHKLQRLEQNVASDIEENQAMDKVVEDENEKLARVSSMVTVETQYDEI